MNVTQPILIGLMFVISLSLIGCTAAPKQIQSGFLKDYSMLKKSTEFKNTSVYHSADFDLKTLKNIEEIYLVPFEIWLNQDNLIGIDDQQLRDLHHYFHKNLKQALQQKYRIVDKASVNSLTIRGAFTGINLTNPELTVSDFLPIKLVFNAGNTAYLSSTDQKDIISSVSIEVEFLMGTTNSRVFAMTAIKKLDLTVSDSKEGNFESVTNVLDVWIENFMKKIDGESNEQN
jgi:hypothetical protein